MEAELIEKKDTRGQKCLPRAPKKKVRKKVPKIDPLSGYLRAQYVRCGRSNCHCHNSNGHGPYYYRVITVDGQKRKTYVRKGEISAVRAGINERRRRLAEVRQVNQEAKQNWRTFKDQLRQLDQLLKIAGYDL
jgi:hypothetical protein